MRTHINIDDALLEEAKRLGDYRTITATVNAALAEHVKQLKRRQLINLRGQFNWQGNLDHLRRTRSTDAS
ncbi:MAG: type II toxin-antitoxin system VapB family antitoxin [Pseudanabaenales cyanobacterium]|nr:type II toxin-antitoxin system VapB family antitoxin [Pseudanabaenales cyanobacterium]